MRRREAHGRPEKCFGVTTDSCATETEDDSIQKLKGWNTECDERKGESVYIEEQLEASVERQR